MIDYAAVLADLRGRREKLDAAIRGIEQILGILSSPVTPALPASVTPVASRPSVGKTKLVAVESKPAPEAETALSAPAPGTIQETLLAVLSEAVALDSIELAQRVERLRPRSSPSSIRVTISNLLREQVLHKGNDLKIRRVVNGKIQGLPPVKGDNAELEELCGLTR